MELVINFSGGKDSTAMLAWLCEQYPDASKHVVMADTGWEWNPILGWKEEHVWSYLRERNIPVHPVYKHLRRFSCRVCIFMTDHDLRQVEKHDTEAIDIIHDIEKKIGFTMFQRGPIKQLTQNESDRIETVLDQSA